MDEPETDSEAGPRSRRLHDWQLEPAEARAVQEQLRDRRHDRPPRRFHPRRVAGADVAFGPAGESGYGAVVVVDLETGETVDRAWSTGPVSFPYVPGLLSFRELPLLIPAWERLAGTPDAVIFDAHGYAHPRRFGLACHGGLVFEVPAVGCAKSVLVGDHDPPGTERGATSPLLDGDEVIGRVVRTRADVRPVFVSVGHRMDLEAAVELVLASAPRFRIPEPVRRADRMVGRLRRGEGPDPT